MTGRFAGVVAIGLALGAVDALAQSYPTKAIRIIVPFPPVGAADLLTRTIGQKLTETWGQQVLVDNRPASAAIWVCKSLPGRRPTATPR